MKGIHILLLLLSFFCSCSTESEFPLERENTKETFFFVVAANGDLQKEGETKATVILHSLPRGKELFVLKETSIDEGCVFLHRTLNETDTLAVTHEKPFKENLEKAVSYISSVHPTNVSLIVFSHATGWYPPKRIKSRSAIVDDYTEISLQELHETVGRLRYKTIVFESCNMGGIECLYQFHDICDFIIASSTELLSPGFLPLYRQGIGSLADREGALSFAQRYASHVKKSPVPYNSCAVAVYQTSHTHELFDFFTKIENITGLRTDIANTQQLHRCKEEEVFYDLESYLVHTALSEKSKQELHEILEKTVIYKYNTNDFLSSYEGFQIKEYCGLSVFDFLSPSPYLASYKKTAFGKFLFGSSEE